MEAAPVLYAVDEKVLVGNNEHQAYVARPVRPGDDAVLVRWESTGAREEVAVGDVKKIDLDAKRPRRKRRDASGAEAAAPARREPPGKRRKKKADADDDESSSVDTTPSVAEIRAASQREQEAARAAASDAEEDAGAEDPSSVREEIERHVKALQSGDADGKKAAVEALGWLAYHDATFDVIAQRLMGLLLGGSADGQEQAALVLAKFASSNVAIPICIVEAGCIVPLVALVRTGAAGGKEAAAVALGHIAWSYAGAGFTRLCERNANQAAIVAAGGVEALVALVRSGAAGGQEEAVEALARLIHCNPANEAEIVEAGGVEALLALVANGAARGQKKAARVLGSLALDNAANQAAIAEAGAIEALMKLVTNGADSGVQDAAAWALRNLVGENASNRTAIATALVALVANGTRGQEQATFVLLQLARYNTANKVAIVAAGAVEAFTALLANGSGLGETAEMALEKLGPLAEYASQLRSENASLQRRLDRYEGSGAIDVTQDDDADDDAQHRDTGLRDLRERASQAKFVEVKKEKEALEDRVLCTICMEADAPRTVLFGPCNHFLACALCADALQECPNCRVPITARTSIANTS